MVRTYHEIIHYVINYNLLLCLYVSVSMGDMYMHTYTRRIWLCRDQQW